MLIKDPPTEITKNVWMLGTAAYPLYLYMGRSSGTIVEGGIGATGPMLREQLEAMNVSPDSIRQVVITHAHFDHVLAVPLFREIFPGISVLASKAAADTLGIEKAIDFFMKIDDGITDSLRKKGCLGDTHQRAPMAEKRIGVDHLLGEGDSVRIDDDTGLQVLATPGHSDCSLSFFEPNGQTLFVSDALGFFLPDADYLWPIYFADYGAYVESIERLAALGAETLCLAHNATIQGADEVAAFFSRALKDTRAYHARIVDETKTGRSVREIAETLGTEVFEPTQLLSPEFFQKNCGVMVKQSLKHEGIEPEKKS